jgi:hypothetical protein
MCRPAKDKRREQRREGVPTFSFARFPYLPCPGGGPSRCQMPPPSVVCLEHPRRLAGTYSGVGLRRCLPSCRRTRPTPLLTIAFTKRAWFDCSVFSTSSKCTLMLTWCPLWVSHSDGGGAHTSIAIPAMCSPVFLIIAFEAIKGSCSSPDVDSDYSSGLTCPTLHGERSQGREYAGCADARVVVVAG